MKKFYFQLILLTIFLYPGLLIAQNDSPLVRYPSLNSDGSKIAFSYQGDIWIVNSDGGDAQRITIHEAYDFMPKWSPDDQSLVFTSNRFSQNDIYTIPVNGGYPDRITFHSTNDQAFDWTTEHEIVFTTNRVYNQVEWDDEIHKVDVSGGTPERYLDAFGDMPAVSPDNRFVALVRGACRIQREGYRGPANKDVWVYDRQNNTYTQLTDFDGNDFYPAWGDARTLYYISAESGKYNVHRLQINDDGSLNGEPSQVSDFQNFGVRYFEVSGDGSKLVMEQGNTVYTQNTSDGSPQQVNINISTDYRFDPIEYETYSNNINEYKISPSGKLTALNIHGEIFVKENNKDKARSVNLSDHAYRDRDPTWLNDSVLIFSSDREGQYDLYLVRSRDPERQNIFKTLKREIIKLTDTPESELNPIISPDGSKIVFWRGRERGRGQLIVANINAQGNISNELVLHDGWAAPGGVEWSPDSRWLAYSLPDLNFNHEVYIHAADNSTDPVNVSMHPRGDYAPEWSPDGSKLGFLSERNNGDRDVWFAWLKIEDWEKTMQDWEEEDDSENGDKKDKDKNGAKEVKPIEIDLENIHYRLEQVTSVPGNESNINISKDGETFYYVTGNITERGNDLFSIKWDGKETKQLTTGGKNPYSVTSGPENKKLYFLSSGRLSSIDPGSKKVESLPHSAKMTIHHNEEKQQIFEEAWSVLEAGFYDPEFHGRDWNALKEKYRNLVLSSSTKRDFRDMFNFMIGQIDASHMGLYGQDRSETQRESSGKLGIEVITHQDGVEIKHVVPKTPADRTNSKLNTGEVILSVNGEKITSDKNFYSLLINQTDLETLLEVRGTNGNVREVIIRPTSSIGRALYDEWVDSRKELTEKYSNGRLGYIHIQGMNWTSFERFERELTASGLGKEGIVIDVRFNGGGWTTDYLMAVLNVRQHAYTIPRGAAENLQEEHPDFKDYYPFGERLPLAYWTKPSIALCNANSYSNAEIFSHAYKNLDIGTLVGQPTFGAVISTGGARLLDGSFVRLPFRGWYVKATGENMEHGPAVPDILVENEPGIKADNEDNQLKSAVEELLKQIDAEK